MLVQIGKECKKEINEKKNFEVYEDFYESIINAVKALTEVSNSINSYHRDYDYKNDMKVLIDRIKDEHVKEEFETRYGPLERHGRMKFKRLNEKEFHDNYHLMFFRFQVLIFEMEKTNRFTWIPSNNQVNTTSLTHRRSIDIAKASSGYDETSKILTITVTNNDMTVNDQESFKIIVPPKLGHELQDLINPIITPSKYHQTHVFDTSVPKHDPFDNNSLSPMCGKCKLLIFGLLFRGYHCKTCKEYYHQQCFENEDKEKIGSVTFFVILLIMYILFHFI